MVYSSYFRASVDRKTCWFFVAALRSFEHLCFDRTYDVSESVFEFFVSLDQESIFLDFMSHFEKQGIISDLQKLPNRLKTDTKV